VEVSDPEIQKEVGVDLDSQHPFAKQGWPLWAKLSTICNAARLCSPKTMMRSVDPPARDPTAELNFGPTDHARHIVDDGKTAALQLLEGA
jgi:hypothetical protein